MLNDMVVRYGPQPVDNFFTTGVFEDGTNNNPQYADRAKQIIFDYMSNIGDENTQDNFIFHFKEKLENVRDREQQGDDPDDGLINYVNHLVELLDEAREMRIIQILRHQPLPPAPAPAMSGSGFFSQYKIDKNGMNTKLPNHKARVSNIMGGKFHLDLFGKRRRAKQKGMIANLVAKDPSIKVAKRYLP